MTLLGSKRIYPLLNGLNGLKGFRGFRGKGGSHTINKYSSPRRYSSTLPPPPPPTSRHLTFYRDVLPSMMLPLGVCLLTYYTLRLFQERWSWEKERSMISKDVDDLKIQVEKEVLKRKMDS